MTATARPGRRLFGVVLAGGASTRFGSPKWLAAVGGEPMGARAVSALAPHVERLAAISGDAAIARLGLEVRTDLERGQGPLGGIRTALAWAAELSLDGVVVLACDLPLVSADLVGVLVGDWDDEEAVAPLGASGPEPLCALYATTALSSVEAELARGGLSPRRLLQRVHARLIPLERTQAVAGWADPFLNVNTEAMRARAEAILATRSPGSSAEPVPARVPG